MPLFKKCALVAALLGAVPLAATAGDAGTLYVQLGSNGLGLGYGLSVGQDFAVRGQYNAYKKTYTGSVSDFGATAVVTADIDLRTLQILADWYTGDSGFRFTGGVVVNNNKITLSATGATVGTATNQTASAEIKLSDSPSPYLGLGYSSRPKFAKGLSYIFDAGIMFQDPKVTLTSSGASAADIEAQRVQVQDAVKDLKNLPVLAFGISYSF